MSKLAILGGKPVGKIEAPTWPIFDETDVNGVADVVRSGKWDFRGPVEQEFEKKWAAFNHAKYGVACTSGTHAIRIALEVLGVGAGDEVIVPALTWQATAASVLDVNAVPILVDIDPTTYTIDPKKIEEAITPRTKCIIPVHLYCRVADMDAIRAIADKYKLYILEDCSHSHGSKWRGKNIGTLGDIGAFSLQGSKLLTTGDGGALLTNEQKYYDLLQSCKICGRPSYEGAPTIQSGNFRMTEMQASIGLTQLARLKAQNDARVKTMKRLEKDLKGIDCVETLRHPDGVTYQAAYIYAFKYLSEKAEGVDRDVFFDAVRAELSTDAFNHTYIPLTDSPLYRPFSKQTHKISAEYCKAIDPSRFSAPEADKAYYKEGVTLFHTIFLGPEKNVDLIADAIAKVSENLDDLKGMVTSAQTGFEP